MEATPSWPGLPKTTSGKSGAIQLIEFRAIDTPLLDSATRRCHIQRMADHDPTNLTLDDWITALDRSDADIDAGDIVPGETVLAELRASIARMEAKQRGGFVK
jgi:hypothetical protein